MSIKCVSQNFAIGDLRLDQFCDLTINPRPTGGPGFPRPAGGGFEHPPSNSAPGPRRDTRKAVFERASIIRKKSLRSLFWSGQRSDNQRSLKPKIRRFVGQMPTIFNKSTHSSETNEATAPQKSAFDRPMY